MSPDILTTFASPVHPPDIGELWMERHQPDDAHLAEWITVTRADPRILISGAIMEEIVGGHIIGSSITPPASERAARHETPIGSVLKVEADNRTVIYRIVDVWPRSYVYVAEWPD